MTTASTNQTTGLQRRREKEYASSDSESDDGLHTHTGRVWGVLEVYTATHVVCFFNAECYEDDPIMYCDERQGAISRYTLSVMV